MVWKAIITVEGNIGAGKTTFLESLRTRLPFVKVLLEPVGEWISTKNADGKSILQLFYEDKSRWSMTFQLYAFLSRLEDMKKLLKECEESEKTEGEPTIILTERSVLTDRFVFAEMLHKQGFLDDLEWTLYLKWFHAYAADVPIQGILYLSTSAATSKERIGIRGREGEASISAEYLDALEAQHRHWVSTTTLPVLEVSTEPGTDEGERLSRIQDWLQTFRKPSCEGI
jgi:deoxyadenosine/deoxycytidine kinase